MSLNASRLTTPEMVVDERKDASVVDSAMNFKLVANHRMKTSEENNRKQLRALFSDG